MEPSIGGGTDPQLLGATAPVLNVVSSAQPPESSEVIDVDIPGMPGHRFGQPKGVGIAATQEGVPEPQVRRELGVVPGVPANVVAPDMAVHIVGVHHIAVIPETVPVVLIHLSAVMLDLPGQPIFDLFFAGRGTIRQAPESTKDTGFQIVLGGGNHLRGLADFLCPVHRLRARGRRGEHTQNKVRGPRYAVGGIKAGFIILVSDFQRIQLLLVGLLPHAIVIEAHVHRWRLGRPEPERGFRYVAPGVANIHLNRVQLPEVPHPEQYAPGGPTHIGHTAGAAALIGVNPGVAALGALFDGEAVGIQLRQRKIIPHRHIVQQAGYPRVPFAQGRRFATGKLCLPHGFARVLTKPGNAFG